MEGPEIFWWLVRISAAVLFLLGLEQGIQGKNDITKVIWICWISAPIMGFFLWVTAKDQEIVSRAGSGAFTAFAAAGIGLGAGFAVGLFCRILWKLIKNKR